MSIRLGEDLLVGQEVRLDAASIEAIANRVVEKLRGDEQLLDAAEVARRLGRSRDWVYRHANELGAVRLGDGDRPRLHFRPSVVNAYIDACKSSRRTHLESTPVAKRKSPAARVGEKAGNHDLLPIRGENLA